MNKPQTITRIRTACTPDAVNVKDVELSCNLSPWTLEDYRCTADDPNYIFLVAVGENEQLTGFFIARLITVRDMLCESNGPDNQENSVETEAEICNIAVRPDLRNFGIGSSLFREFISAISDRTGVSVFLEVRESNINAINFYNKFGFEYVSKRKGFYRNPEEDALVMKAFVGNQSRS